MKNDKNKILLVLSLVTLINVFAQTPQATFAPTPQPAPTQATAQPTPTQQTAPTQAPAAQVQPTPTQPKPLVTVEQIVPKFEEEMKNFQQKKDNAQRELSSLPANDARRLEVESQLAAYEVGYQTSKAFVEKFKALSEKPAVKAQLQTQEPIELKAK